MKINARDSNPLYLGDGDMKGQYSVTGETEEVILWHVSGKHSKLWCHIPVGRESKSPVPQDEVEDIQIGTFLWIGNLASNQNSILQSADVCK